MKLLKFTSQTCAPCQELTKVLYDLLPEDFSHIELVEINVTVDKEAAKEWNLRGVPTLILLDDFDEDSEINKSYFRGFKNMGKIIGVFLIITIPLVLMYPIFTSNY